jgi:hypothetical protein
MPAVGEASMIGPQTSFSEKRSPGMVRAIIAKAETPHYTVSLDYLRKKSLAYTHPEDTYITLFENTHQEEP